MALPTFKNLAVMTVSGTPGTGTITLGAAVPPYLSLAAAGIADGQKVTYSLTDGTSNSEIGQGTYTSSGTTLSRDTVYRSTGAGNTAKISATSATIVEITIAAEDVVAIAAGLVTPNYYNSTQTITIPVNATRARIRLWGGSGGGAGRNASNTGTPGAGAGYLEKFLTGLVAGNTLALTIGAAGAAGAITPAAGGDGGNSTLASGTQTISTLTANGGKGGPLGPSGAYVAAVGGTASGGDINIPGQSAGFVGDLTTSNPGDGIGGGMTGGGMSVGGNSKTTGTAAVGNAGTVGGCIIDWFY